MAPVPGLLFWQPVLSGKQFLQQFLRLKIAAQILGPADAARIDTRELRERLLRGRSVEVAGYELSPGFAAGLEAAELAPIPGASPVAWIEIAAQPTQAISPAGRARADAVEERRARGRRALCRRPGFLADAGNHRMSGADRGDARGAGGGSLVSAIEQALTFDCDGERLVGVVAVPERPVPVGVLIVVGGPQYRAGSHRQFVHLARRLAGAGIAAMRFDYRGMGDASGDARSIRGRVRRHRRRDRRVPARLSRRRARRALGSMRRGVGVAHVRRQASATPVGRRDRAGQPVGALRRDACEDADQALLRATASRARFLGRSCCAEGVDVARRARQVAQSARNARRSVGAGARLPSHRLPGSDGVRDCRLSPDRSCC